MKLLFCTIAMLLSQQVFSSDFIKARLMDHVVISEPGTSFKIKLLENVVDPTTDQIVLKKGVTLNAKVSNVNTDKGIIEFTISASNFSKTIRTRGSVWNKDGQLLYGAVVYNEEDGTPEFMDVSSFINSKKFSQNSVYVPKKLVFTNEID